MFLLKKIVGFWLMPLPFALTLLVLGSFLLTWKRFPRLGRNLVLLGVAWLVVFSNAGVGTVLVRGLENQFAAAPTFDADIPLPTNLKACAFVAVLGGGHSPAENRPASLQLSSSALSRIIEGVRILRQLPDAKLVVSGGASTDGGPTHAHILALTAISLGVPEDRIIERPDVLDTADEAAALRKLSGDEPVAVVTSAWHLPRAVALCEKTGLQVVPCPADYLGRDMTLTGRDFLRWDLGGLERSTRAFHEATGLIWSWVRGQT